MQRSQEGISANGGDSSAGFTGISYMSSNGQVTISMAGNDQHNLADQLETVAPENLIAQQQLELTTFAAQTINQIRQRVRPVPL